MHALLRILLEKGNLNLQAHTPATHVSERDADGWITVKTQRGTLRARAVVHATNRWASHLLPEFGKLILPDRSCVAAIKAPEGFIKHTGAQHWDSVVNVRPIAAHHTVLCLTNGYNRTIIFNSPHPTMPSLLEEHGNSSCIDRKTAS